MWPAIQELMEQFKEAVIVLDEQNEIAVVNQAAQAHLDHLGMDAATALLGGVETIRVLRVPPRATAARAMPELPAAIRHLDEVSSGLPVILSIRTLENYMYISPAFEKIFGRDSSGLLADLNAFQELVHPDDREMVRLHLEADSAGAAQDYEFRILHANGGVRWMRVRVHPFFDDSSKQLLIASLTEDVTDLRQRRGRKRASVETVSEIVSTGEFRKALEQSVDQWRSDPASSCYFAVALIDVVRFRAVNDSFGYAEGDRLLKEIGRRIREALPTGNRVARFGSDCFALLLRSCADTHQAEELLRQILLAVSISMELGQTPITIAARAGLAFPDGIDCSADSVLRDVDAALQIAKQRREPLVVSSMVPPAKSMERSTLEFDLARALDQDEFFFEFQPVFDPVKGNVKMLEALVRWRHPRLGTISPSSFISLAEDSGLVLRLDMQGLERLGRQLDLWRILDPRIANLPVSINISGRHFPGFAMENQFHSLLQSPALSQSTIIFEITESVFVESSHHTAAGLERLRAAGVQIWLDDFGDGYSSFRYLTHFPVDGIKISESFVKQCVTEPKVRVILSSLQSLARGLGVQTIVEGVETKEQFETLKAMGFDALQGYYLARPMAAKEIPSLFAEVRAKSTSRKKSA